MPSKWSYLLLVFFLSLSGCAWFNGSPDQASFAPYDAYSVHDSINLPRGAKLVIIPFTAGVGVVENDELEHIAIIVARGIAETISASAGTLEIIGPEMAKDADYLIEGHITDIGQTGGGVLPWGKGRESYLGIEALVTEAKTGHTIMRFEDRQSAEDSSSDVRQLALVLGREFAQWLVKRTE